MRSARFSSLVFHAADQGEPDRPVPEVPDAVHELGARVFHASLDLVAGKVGVVRDAGAPVDVVDGEEVEVEGADVADHRECQAAEDVPRDEVPVDEVLHGLADLLDGERG